MLKVMNWISPRGLAMTPRWNFRGLMDTGQWQSLEPPATGLERESEHPQRPGEWMGHDRTHRTWICSTIFSRLPFTPQGPPLPFFDSPFPPRFVKLVRRCRNFDRQAAVAAFHEADERRALGLPALQEGGGGGGEPGGLEEERSWPDEVIVTTS